MKLILPSIEMMVNTFVKGLKANSFNESLLWNPTVSLTKVCSRVPIHI